MKHKTIYDPLYGFIKITPLEWEIIHTPFYQRLRWIKQIGFSYYTFHGAEHSRFGHSIGVMYNAHEILRSIGKNVSDKKLFSAIALIEDPDILTHQSIRVAALLHDLGTFCFSHTTEMAYIRFAQTANSKKHNKTHPDNHEHLGSWIIKNTDYEQGITSLLKKYGLNPQVISDMVKGVSDNILANQILHSEIDCDRMDYLLRDAHYTGLNYGTYDRDYLLHHFRTVEVAGQDILVIKHNALHCIEDFLNARFAWYSQVVRSARGARFDVLAEELTFFLLEKGHIYTYEDLLNLVKESPLQFYHFNDTYFMGLIHRLYTSGELDKYPKYKEIANAVLFANPPRTIRCAEFSQRIIDQDDKMTKERIDKKAQEKVIQLNDSLIKHGGVSDWLVADIPERNLVFLKSKKQVIKSNESPNLMLERDPVKILTDDGKVSLLVDLPDSTISRLQNIHNFIPNVFCSDSAYQLLQKQGLIPE